MTRFFRSFLRKRESKIAFAGTSGWRATEIQPVTARQRGTSCNSSSYLREDFPMVGRCFVFCGMILACMTVPGFAQSTTPNGVQTLNPPGAISTGSDTWSVGARAGDFIFVAGMQGVDPVTNKLVEGNEARIRQAFLNLKRIADSEGATLQDCVRITVYVSDLHRFAPLVSKVQAELWGKPPYPPRTMFEVQRLFDDDIVEIDSIFYAPRKK
jgi:enamine deaminase RidA (YjgF/YER057c/UK114 family)